MVSAILLHLDLNQKLTQPKTTVPFLSENSYVRSVPDYPVKIDGEFLHGSDFIRGDPDGDFMRLDVNSVVKDKGGAVLAFRYSGMLRVTKGVARVLGGSKEAATTTFGDACEFVFLRLFLSFGGCEI